MARKAKIRTGKKGGKFRWKTSKVTGKRYKVYLKKKGTSKRKRRKSSR